MRLVDKSLIATVRTREAMLASLVGACAGALALALILMLSPLAAGWVVLGISSALLVIFYPFAGLLLLPFAVAYGSLVSIDVHGLHLGPTDLLTGAIALGLIIRAVRWYARQPLSLAALAGEGRIWVRRAWHDKPAVVLLFIGLAAYLLTVTLSVLVAESRTLALKEVVKWSEVTVIVASTGWLIQSATRLRLVVWIVIAASVSEALLGYIQWILALGDFGPGGASIRVFGTFAQPNPYAAYLNFAFTLTFALVVFGRTAIERWLAGGLGIITLGALVLADSRGALLGAAAAVLVMVIVGLSMEKPALIAAVIAIPAGLAAWFAHVIPIRLQTRILATVRVADLNTINNANFSTQERLAHWTAGLRMFLANPVLGVGAGNYNEGYARYGDLRLWPEGLGQAHNYYINAAAETGILGALAFLLLTGALLLLGWYAARGALRVPQLRQFAHRLEPGRVYALGFLGLLVAVATHNLTDDLFVHAMELEIAISAGCLVSLSTFLKRY